MRTVLAIAQAIGVVCGVLHVFARPLAFALAVFAVMVLGYKMGELLR